MKNYITIIFSFIRHVWIGAHEFVKDHVRPTIKFISALKAVVDNPMLDFATALTPTGLDDRCLALLRTYLSKATSIITLEQKLENMDPEQRIQFLIDYLKKLSPEMRDAIYHKLASVMAKLASEKTRIKDNEIDLLVSMELSRMKAAGEENNYNNTKTAAAI